MKAHHWMILTTAVGVLAACGATTRATRAMAEPPQSIAAAEEAGANEIPGAALYLEYARRQFEQGARHLDDGEEEEAQRFFERAKSDAEVALQTARLHRLREEANAAMTALDQVRRKQRGVGK